MITKAKLLSERTTHPNIKEVCFCYCHCRKISIHFHRSGSGAHSTALNSIRLLLFFMSPTFKLQLLIRNAQCRESAMQYAYCDFQVQYAIYLIACRTRDYQENYDFGKYTGWICMGNKRQNFKPAKN